MFRVEESAAWQRAKTKAAETRPRIQVMAVGDYRVEGSVRSNFYRVSIKAEGQATVIDCNCLGGSHDKPCYHAAAILPSYLASIGARDKRLKLIESDLRFISNRAADAGADFDVMEDIQRAVRAALLSLDEYELELMPATEEVAA
jgi:uncharacterized Zn finger protein